MVVVVHGCVSSEMMDKVHHLMMEKLMMADVMVVIVLEVD